MGPSTKTRWIIALIILAVAVRGLTFVPQLDYAAVISWGLSLACLIAALVLAVLRSREQKHSSDVDKPEYDADPSDRRRNKPSQQLAQLVLFC